MSDIFISYASEDKEKAGLLAKVFEQQGWSVWWDRLIPPGRTFNEVIQEALDAAKCVVVLWSKASVKSDWVQEEASEGNSRKILVPAMIEDVNIPLGFRRIQAAQLIDWDGEKFHQEVNRLIDSVEKILGIPRKVKREAKRVEEKKAEDETLKQVSKEPNAVDEQAKSQPLHVEKVEPKPITTEKIEKKPIEQPSHKNKAEEDKKHKSKRQQDATTKSAAIKRSRLPWLLPAIIVPFIIGVVMLALIYKQPDSTVLKKEHTDKEEVGTSVISETIFRSISKENLSVETAKSMLKEKHFFDYYLNNTSSGFVNDYDIRCEGNVVYDRASGLMWQQSESHITVMYKEVKAYLVELNINQYAGYNDWRLPTLEEAMTLMESKENNAGMYIDSRFNSTDIWTSDIKKTSVFWIVSFGSGTCNFYKGSDGSGYKMQAVRSVINKVEYQEKVSKAETLQTEIGTFESSGIIKPKIVEKPIISKTNFRTTPEKNLSEESVKNMLKDKGFYDNSKNNSASGFSNDYKLQNDGKVVFDRASGLMWQQSGSDEYMRYDVKSYITRLNSNKFAGHNDWRLPTLEEAMSLMEPTKKSGDLYIDPVFDKNQRYIWTSDLYKPSSAWVVSFNLGYCRYLFGSKFYVRAVR